MSTNSNPFRPNPPNKPSRYRRFAVAILCIGLVHWIYLTWDNPWGTPRYSLISMRVVYFKWNRADGFKEIRVKAYPGDWLGATLLRQLMILQLKPRISFHSKRNSWDRLDGEGAFTVLNFLPIVISDSWGTDSWTFRDPDKTPLMSAVGKGDIQSVIKLISAGVNVNAEDQNGWTALFYALTVRDTKDAVQETKLLLAAGANIEFATRLGYTPLMKAAQNGQLEAVRALLEAGADPNARNHNGETAVLLASREGYVDVVALLKGANSENR